MLEQTLGFLRREQYIDPRYKRQIEDWDKKQQLERGKKIAGVALETARGNILTAIAKSLGIAQDIRSEIKAGDTSSFPYLLGLAILVDVADFIPVVSLIVQCVAYPILIYGTLGQGRYTNKIGIRLVFYGLNFLEIVPFVSWIPLETLSIILLWRATLKQQRAAEAEAEETEQLAIGQAKELKKLDNTPIEPQYMA